MKQKRTYRTPEVAIEYFLAQEYMMMSPLSRAEDPGSSSAPKPRTANVF